jgi:hypothetical protein
VNLSSHHITNRLTQRPHRAPAGEHTARFASDHGLCEQLRFDHEAIARLENEGGRTSPVFPEQDRELPRICNPTAETQSIDIGSSVLAR